MDQNGTFEGMIIGAGTKLRTEHSTVGGTATVLNSYGANLLVKATKKWICDVADTAKNWQVGDTWIYVTTVGGINVVDGWMAVIHHGAAIVNLTVDLPDVVTPPDVPADNVVVNSVTLDYNAAGEIIAVWVNNVEWSYIPFITPPPVG
ncbi:MAG: hypothetical protein IPF77_17085 [Gemmatimonadetes bacterium]|nr:hypothetical protein [Gemmatimonadota bacterium]